MKGWLIRCLTVALAAALLVSCAALAEELDIEAIEGVESIESLDAPEPVGVLATPEFEAAEATELQSNALESDFAIRGNVLVGYFGSDSEVVIPEGVTVIGEDVFDGNETVKRVILPKGLKVIQNGAFCWARNLESLEIPDGVTTIENRAFEGCIGMKSIWIPASVTTIGRGNFVYWDDDDDGLRILPKLTIYGYVGSAAETFAKHAYVDEYDDDYLGNMVIPFKALINKARLTVKDAVYTGKAVKPAVTVKLGGKVLTKGKDYKVTYKNNKKVGTATVIAEGKGDYAGAVGGVFRIYPKSVTGLKLQSGKGQIAVSWKKNAGVSGYELQYGLKKNFSDATTLTIKKAAAVKASIKKLKSKKFYYVRIRAYQLVGKDTFFSKWSAAKRVKVK